MLASSTVDRWVGDNNITSIMNEIIILVPYSTRYVIDSHFLVFKEDFES